MYNIHHDDDLPWRVLKRMIHNVVYYYRYAKLIALG